MRRVWVLAALHSLSCELRFPQTSRLFTRVKTSELLRTWRPSHVLISAQFQFLCKMMFCVCDEFGDCDVSQVWKQQIESGQWCFIVKKLHFLLSAVRGSNWNKLTGWRPSPSCCRGMSEGEPLSASRQDATSCGRGRRVRQDDKHFLSLNVFGTEEPEAARCVRSMAHNTLLHTH